MRRDLILRNTPPGWNVRIFTEADFYKHCDGASIFVREVPLEQPGLYIHPQIFINDKLRSAEKLFVSFHELAHHWLHPPGVQMFRGWRGRVELEADAVAVCCLIPKTILTHYWPSEIAELYGYPHDLITLRCEVFDRYRI